MLLAAFACFGVLVYTYLGYPVLIALLARLRPLRVREDESFTPKVSVVIPVYNGAAYLDAKLASVLGLDWPAEALEVLIYSDGSSDDTAAIVRRWAARDRRVRLVEGRDRAGKPTGLNQLREAATGEVLFITDVRQPINPGALRAMVRRLADPQVGCVSGNLVLAGAAGSSAYWRYEKFVRRQEAHFRSIVGVSGSIVVLRKADLPPLPTDLILDDVFIPMRLRMQGRLVLFAAEAQAFDVAFEDDREFSRKVRTLAGNYQLFALLPGLLWPPANPSWWETISHKLLRLFCPYLLLACLLLAIGALFADDLAERRLAAALVAGQVGFYLAAVAGKRLGKLGSLARTFVVMNAAAAMGLWRFLTHGQRVTW
jgi:cellulose synthase/poly-beta-1,6-N-acetylglucosamine synthase-like glycosyltransferase